ncbi:MAG: hydroxymethylbilane synthase [Thermodesulfobacteriota bacterium]|nr:hydroxymethylbilane synthase [Thermodesulfobacteriota bacterium]
MKKTIAIGTRASQLAIAQAKWVMDRILARYPALKINLIKIKTRGDRILDKPLSTIGGKGLFVKEIEEALIRKEIDLAVHSLKDVPAELPNNLCIGIIPVREDPRDAFISTGNISIEDLSEGASVGTSSLRRSAQLLRFRPDLKILPLRGNIDTRIKKLKKPDLQAIIVAAAGLNRLGLKDIITHCFSVDIMLPALGQGALGLELREDDIETRDLLAFLDHYTTRMELEAERSLLLELQGGCQVPIGGLARMKDGHIYLDGLVADLDGKTVFRDAIVGLPENAKELGATLAHRLLDAGASKILQKYQ